MPPLPVVTDGAQVVVHGTGPSALTFETVLGFELTITLNTGVADALAGYVSDALNEVKGAISDQFSWSGVTITDLRTVGGPQIDSDAGFPVDGTDSSAPLPLQTAGLITWTTDRRGKSFTGRTYLPGFTESDSDGAHMVSGAHTEFTAFADSLLASNPNWAIISRYSGVDPDTHKPILRNPGIVTPITGRIVHDLWATQRRRAPR